MPDQRFDDRLKRIEKRQRGALQVDVLAGVGVVSDAKAVARKEPFPMLTMILGLASGFAALFHLNAQFGVAGARAVLAGPDTVLELAQTNPILAAAAGWLAVIAGAFVFALLVRRTSARFHAFAFTGCAGAVAAMAVSVADPAVLLALIETYLPQL